MRLLMITRRDTTELMSLQLARMDAEQAQANAQAAQAKLEADVEKANKDLQANIEKANRDLETRRQELEANLEKANQDLESRRQQIQKELDETRAKDLETIKANTDAAIAEVQAVKEKVEQARKDMATQAKALRDSAADHHAALKAHLSTIADTINAGAAPDKPWASKVILEGKQGLLKQLDEVVEGIDALRGWIEPRPVDKALIAETIAKDLKTLQVQRGADQ